jgi:hypothetical protein
MKPWRRFEDWANLILGAYLFFVPFFFAALAAGCAVVALAGLFDPALRRMECPSEEPARADAAGSRGASVG